MANSSNNFLGVNLLMPSLRHTHTYERIKNTDQYRCIHPDCSHFAYKKFLLGKRALCKCGEAYILDRNQLMRNVPHCFNCTRATGIKQKQRVDVLQKIKGLIEAGEIAEYGNSIDPRKKDYEI